MSDAKQATTPAPKNATLRKILGALGGAAYVTGQATGYDYGTPTTLGIDAGLLRDLVAGAFAILATFWPQAASIGNTFKAFGKDPRVDQLAEDQKKLAARITLIESGVKT